MAKPSNLQKQISRRAFVFGGVQATAMSLLVGRLFFLQFVHNEEYENLAEGNSVKVQLIPPVRGDLLDRFGEKMVTNQTNYRAVLEREKPKQARESFQKLSDLLGLSAQRSKMLLAEIDPRLSRPPMLIKDHLSWDEVSKIEFHSPHLPGVVIEEGQHRHYLLGEKAAHVLGYIGRVSEQEVKDQPLLKLPDFKIGKNGCELLLEEELRGTAGTKHIEVNVTGLSVRDLNTNPAKAGANIRTTLDKRLQEFASDRLGEESGAIVVMNIHNGDVLAFASMPAFDPNTFSVGIKNDYWNKLHDDEKHPLINKAISGLYPPGSTFKMLVGLSALREGIANESASVYCPGHFFLGSHMFKCWKEGGHGTVNLRKAITESCDTYFYTMAQRVKIDAIEKICREFGLGETYLGLLGEKEGVVPSPEWKKKRYNQPWVPGDTINVGIGQGYVLTTPLQLAVMTARMANGGKKVVPRLVVPQDDTQTSFDKIDIDEKHLHAIWDGMNDVVNAPNGTARASAIKTEGLSMAGKTGTAQVKVITQRGVDQKTLPWHLRHHAWFVAYAPVIDPKFAACVLIEHGGGGAAVAAPVARDVLEKLLIWDAEKPYEST